MVIGGFRLLFGLLGLTAVTVGFVQSSIDAVSYFSFFTILSNILAAAVLLYGVRPRDSVRYERERCAATVYMTITGVVYGLLLSGYPAHSAWINNVEHRIMPVVVVLDWLLIAPRHRLSTATAMTILAFPAAYIAYTEIRGAIVDWYPYPFLDPREGGVGRVVAYSTGIAVAFLIVALLAAWRSRYPARQDIVTA